MNKIFAAAVVALAGSATAQELVITVDVTDASNSTISAELLDAGQVIPDGAAFSIVSFFEFQLSASGGFNSVSVDAAYQSPIFGFVEDAANGVLQGQTDLPPLGAFQDANPVALGSFSYNGDFQSFEVVGQFDAGFDAGGLFPDTFTYQNADGSAGDVAFRVEIVPAPATAGLLGLGGLAAARRRR